MTVIFITAACAPTYYVIGDVTHRNNSGQLLCEYPSSVIATQNYDYGLHRYVEYKSFTGNGFFFNDRLGEHRFICGGIIQIDSIHLVKIDDYEKSKVKEKTTVPRNSQKDNLINEYNRNKQLIKELRKLMYDTDKSNNGNGQYINDTKKRLRILRNRQNTIQRILYRDYNYS